MNKLYALSEKTGKTTLDSQPFHGDQRWRASFRIVLESDVFENTARAREVSAMKDASIHPAHARVLQFLQDCAAGEGPPQCQKANRPKENNCHCQPSDHNQSPGFVG